MPFCPGRHHYSHTQLSGKERLCDLAKVTQKTVTKLGTQPAPRALTLTPTTLCFPKSAFPLLLQGWNCTDWTLLWSGVGLEILILAGSCWEPPAHGDLDAAEFCSPEQDQTQDFVGFLPSSSAQDLWPSVPMKRWKKTPQIHL